MPATKPSERPAWPRLTLKRLDQVGVAACLTLALAALGVHWVHQGRFRGRLIEIERATPQVVEFKIDINQADWPELCLMPGIGESLSKRIVEHRALQGPFHDLQDLRRVRGIGPKTLDGMKPYLLPLADVEATAGAPGGNAANTP